MTGRTGSRAPRLWYLMTRYSISRGGALWFESAHGSRDSCRAKAERLLALPVGSSNGVVAASVWYRGDTDTDPRTEAEKAADALMKREGWKR